MHLKKTFSTQADWGLILYVQQTLMYCIPVAFAELAKHIVGSKDIISEDGYFFLP